MERTPIAVWLAVVVLAAHGLALLAPFQFDDLHQIVGNPAFRGLEHIPDFFLDPRVGSTSGNGVYYRPVLFLTFLLDGLVGGGSAVPYRITSLLLLFVLTLEAVALARVVLPRLTPELSTAEITRASSWCGLLVAAHPLLDESVLLATGRSSLLVAVFGIPALILLVHRNGGGVRQKMLAILLTTLALLSKEEAIAVVLPALFLVLTLRVDQPWWRRAFTAWPVLVPATIHLAFFLFVLPEMAAASRAATNAGVGLWYQKPPWIERPGEGGLALLGLLRLSVLPFGLSLVHELPPLSAGLRILGWLAWPAVLGGGYLALRREGAVRSLGFSVIWSTLALMPVLLYGLNTPMAEHRMPLAMVGFILAVGLGLTRAKASLQPWLGGVIVVGLCALGAWHAHQWRSPETLWEHEVKHQPESARAWSFLAEIRHRDGDPKAAREIMDRVLKSNPRHPIYLTQATLYTLEMGEVTLAGNTIRQAVQIAPNMAAVRGLEARWLATVGRPIEAEKSALRAVDLAPRVSGHWNTLGTVRFMRGLPSSRDAYRRALILDPQNEEASYNLGLAEKRFGTGGSLPR